MVALWVLLAAAQAATVLTDEAKNRPVTKVINLLKDMQAQLSKEQDEDEEVYQKVACWCETNDKEKDQTIKDAEARITDLTSTIEEKTAGSSRLATEIKNLDAEIAGNTEALDKATAIREKQLGEFNAEEKDLLQSIGALKSAITVLSKHHAPEEGALLSVAVLIRHEFKIHKALLAEIVTPEQRKTVAAFMQSPGDYLDSAFMQDAGTSSESYAPQSGEIFGILSQMKETFENNLSATQKDEMSNQQAYEDLKTAKMAEIKAGQDQRDTKAQELADTDQALAQAKQDIEDTRNSLSADQVFLMNLKQTCQQTDAEWAERQKARQEEIQAVSEALAVLSSDDAHDNFSKTLGFLQVREDHKDRRTAAAEVLSAAAKKAASPQLAALATSTRLDAFTKVIAAIDEMVVALIEEKADEIKHKDYCTDEINQNDRAQELKERDIDKLDASIATLTSTIEGLAESIKTAQAEIVEMQTQVKRAGEDREAENKDFQMTVADQRETQKLLQQALNVLKAVYAKKESLVQVTRSAQPGPPPPPGFGEYKKAGGAGGVLGLLEQIIAEARQLEIDAQKAEQDAQKAYEAFVKDTNTSIDEKNRDITNKTAEKAGAEGDKTAAEEAHVSALNEQQMNKNEEADLHKSCDFVLKNFDIRQAARDQEVEALRQAKAILSGSKFTEFLQRR